MLKDALGVWHEAIRTRGFAFAHADDVRGCLATAALGEWVDFADSWNRLGPDSYLAATGRQRRRRHAVFHSRAGALERQPHQPHFQARTYNALQGDIERWFEPIEDAVADGVTLRALIAFGDAVFGDLATAREARVEVHQFRIEASAGHPGEPTPEGVHRDGVDFVLVALVQRENIASGTTTIHDANGTMLGEFTLAQPLDAALVDDARVFHGVTPVEPLDPTRPAFRDVLVVTYRALPGE